MPSFFEQDPKNPYLPSGGQQLSQLLMSLGAGFSMAGANNQPWWAGIAPGAAMYGQAQQQAQQNALAMQQRDENLAYRKLQEEQMRAVIDERKAATAARMGFKLDDDGGTGSASPVGMGVKPPAPTMGPQPGTLNIPQAATAIGKIEGDYNSVGPVANAQGNRAYGKYQVMDFNIGPWTKEVLGTAMTPEQFLADRGAQDAVFNSKFGAYANKYGPEGAARAWFAGEGGMNNPGAKDVLGTTVAGYGRKFADLYGMQNPEAPPESYRGPGTNPMPPVPEPGIPPVVGGPPQAVPLAPVTPVQYNPLDAAGQPPMPRVAELPPLPPQIKAQLEADAQRPGSNLDAIRARAYQIRKDMQAQRQAELNAQYQMEKEIWEKKYGQADKLSTEQRAEERAKRERDAALNTDGEWVRGTDGVERWVTKADRKPGMVRTDKPDKETAPGTPTGDIRILETGDPTTREYYAAHVRQRSRLIEGPDGQKYMPDMSAYRTPTFTPEGGAQPAPAPVGKPDATGLVPVGGNKAKIEDENKLRDDFERSPVVKQYRVVVPMLESAKDAATRPTRAADINLVYAFAKLMDPDSVVRESETGMVTATGTVGDKLAGYLGQLNGGPMLRDDTRKKLIAELDSRFKPMKESYDVHEKAFRGIAERRGLNIENVIIPTRNAPVGGDAPKPAPVRINLDGTPAK